MLFIDFCFHLNGVNFVGKYILRTCIHEKYLACVRGAYFMGEG